MESREEILGMIRRITSAWLEQRFDELDECFDEDMVLTMPGFTQRVAGRKAIVDSYRDFAARATIHDFTSEDPSVDIVEGTAIATTPFEISYAFGGEDYKESGVDVLVFSRRVNGWRAVWRTVIMDRQGKP